MSRDKEVQEAISAGEEALDVLHAAQKSLKSANTASWFDILGAGGLFADLYKYNKLEDVKEQMRLAQKKVEAFEREFSDIDAIELPSLDISFGMEFFDIAFDNIFSDLMVKNKINDARARLQKLIDTISELVETLKREHT